MTTRILLAFCLLVLSLSAHSQDTAAIQAPVQPPYSGHEINREKIQIDDLPFAVKESLRSGDYVSWSVESAYKTMMTDPESPESEGIAVYLVEARKDGETVFLRFDKDGQLLDDPDE